MFDVVVVGAGFAGASVAYFLSRVGVKTLVIDVKSWDRIGDRPCGDAISKHYFDESGLPYPKGDELEGTVKGIVLYSPSESSSMLMSGEGFEVNGVKYLQRLLGEALSRGCEFLGNAHVRGPIVKDGYVVGVKVWSNGLKEIYSKVVIDASGNARAVVRALPPTWPVSEVLDLSDANIAYREVRVLTKDIKDPEILRIYLNAEVAPGGYWWFFPYSVMEGYVNVGLGIRADLRHLHPKDLLYKYVLSRPEFKDSKVVKAGGALVPTRRPVESLVWNGIAVVGDAAYTVNPIHGGGKGSSMISARCVVDAVVDALALGDTSAKALWSANLCYVRRYGRKQGVLDILRCFIQKLSNEDLEYVISRKIVSSEEIYEMTSKGKLELRIVDKVIKLVSLMARPTLLIELRNVAKYMEIIEKHYVNYPQRPEELVAWREKLKELINTYKRTLR